MALTQNWQERVPLLPDADPTSATHRDESEGCLCRIDLDLPGEAGTPGAMIGERADGERADHFSPS